MAMGLAAAFALAGGAHAGEALPVGLFAITARLELPHLERWAVDKTRAVCLDGAGGLPIPVLNTGTGLAHCAAAEVQRGAAGLSYAIVCPGRDATRATARYRVEPDRFQGRVAIVMGAKNMTMTEVQVGRRLGACAPGGPLRRISGPG
jgi:hypothetical protein